MESFASYNPVTGEVIGKFPLATAEDVACALERAREASAIWAALSVQERCERLEILRGMFGAEADALAAAVSREIGKPLQDAYGADVLPTVQGLSWLLKNAPRLLRPRRIPGARNAELTPQPYGVVGVIGTWNYPLFLDGIPILWALAAGNAVVWKPSELATDCALTVLRLFERAGLPVFVVTGDGTTGRELCRADIDKLAFTGGVRTGRAILAELAKRNTPSVMELSGNDAMLVCADADVTLTAKAACWARFCNAGQSCVAPQRLFVARSVYDEFLRECQAVAQTLRPGADYGPLRTDALRCQTHDLVWSAVSDGAKLLTGGHALTDRPGFFYAPTLLADCRPEMAVMAQDFFGPVLPVCPVRDESQAVAFANADDMGLGASVWTRDVKRGRQRATQLRAGVVAVNQETLLLAGNPALPFGGTRDSGFGKLRGAAGLDEFVQWQTVLACGAGGARRHLFPYRPDTVPILRGFVALQAAQGAGAKWRAIQQLLQAMKNYSSTKDTKKDSSTDRHR